ncbi:MAG TPA: protein kinase [Vicinamibacterales bacterium]|nr:protein kinase [Vicinamibacterales bacterium]
MTASPTITTPAHLRQGSGGQAMTRVGVILGTAAYMSPEQARGREADRRSDMWSFGCVLFELLCGKRAFPGDDVAETLATVIKGQPDWAALPPHTPIPIRRLLRRCLMKNPKDRLADASTARFEIDDVENGLPLAEMSIERNAERERRSVWLPISASVLTVAAIIGGLWLTRGAPASSSPGEMRVEITTPPTTDRVSIALSPDGEKLAFVASSDGRPMLWLRSLTTGEPAPLPRTDGASFPFWSPDSRSIGFFANDRVNRIGIDGGSFRELAYAPVGTGGTWGRDGVSLFTIVPDGPISRVSETGTDFVAAVPGSDRPLMITDSWLLEVPSPDPELSHSLRIDAPPRRSGAHPTRARTARRRRNRSRLCRSGTPQNASTSSR